MFGFIHSALDILFPPSTEAQLVRSLSDERVLSCIDVRSKHGTVILTPFADTRMQALIHEAKFHNNARAHMLLGAILNAYLKTHPPRPDAYFIPVPLSKKRKRERGYNQVTAVLTHAGLPLHTRALIRSRDTTPQTKLQRTERLTNMTDAFTVATESSIHDRHIVLIDDVTTTGATIGAATKALRSAHPASITTIALTG